MTEIVSQTMKFKKGIGFCAIDNHRRKTGKSFDILYIAKTKQQLENYMFEKGIWV